MSKAYRLEQLVSDLCDDEKRNKAIVILVNLGVHIVADLLKIMEYKDMKTKKAIAAVIFMIGRPAVDTLLATLENSDDVIVKRLVIKILGELGDARAVNPLLKILKSDDRKLNDDVLDALTIIHRRLLNAYIPVETSFSVCV